MKHLASVCFALLVLGTITLSPAVLADGGTVVELTEPAEIIRNGKSTPASVGSRVEPGNTLTTGKFGKAQLRFDDDSIFAVVRGSAFRVDQFQKARNESSGNAIFSLLRGGFRTITGLIGKAKSDKYEVRTGVATIGVRGSAYSALLCAGQCGKKHKDGLYIKAERGIIIVANTGGKLELRAGQAAYAESEIIAPIRVKVTPFDDAAIAAEYDISVDYETEVQPPRIEPEPPGSPS